MSDAPVVIETDAVIVGAGPVGLFQVFELGLLEVKCHVVDALPYPGGQCIELYPDKPIYDIPSVPLCTGKALTDRLLEQIQPFGATFHLGQEVVRVERQADQRFAVETSNGTRFITTALIVAAGVGAFRPRTLRIEGLDRFEGTQLFHRMPDPARLAGRRMVIVGDGDAALDAALHVAQAGPDQAAAVTLVHRRDSFRAAPARVERMRALCEAQQMQFVAGQVTGFVEAAGVLSAVQIADSAGAVRSLPTDVLLVSLGLSPKLGPIAEWGLDIDRKQVVVDTAKFETNVPGIFAVGDINAYAGKRKLIVCGFHEATLAAFAAAARVFPDKQIPLQYTTTSPRLHKLLGLQSPVFD